MQKRVWNPSTCICENGKYLASTMDDSVITCDEVIESYSEEMKAIPTNFNKKNITCKAQSFYVLLTFLLVTIVLQYKLKMSVKDIIIKNHMYYFFDDITNIKDFDPNNIEID